MAQIVLGIGTSHGPMLVTETELWGKRIPADRANLHAWRGERWSFDKLVEARSNERLDRQITKDVWDSGSNAARPQSSSLPISSPRHGPTSR